MTVAAAIPEFVASLEELAALCREVHGRGNLTTLRKWRSLGCPMEKTATGYHVLPVLGWLQQRIEAEQQAADEVLGEPTTYADWLLMEQTRATDQARMIESRELLDADEVAILIETAASSSLAALEQVSIEVAALANAEDRTRVRSAVEQQVFDFREGLAGRCERSWFEDRERTQQECADADPDSLPDLPAPRTRRQENDRAKALRVRDKRLREARGLVPAECIERLASTWIAVMRKATDELETSLQRIASELSLDNLKSSKVIGGRLNGFRVELTRLDAEVRTLRSEPNDAVDDAE